MIQHITYGVGGTVSLQANQALTTPTVSIHDGLGLEMVSATTASQSTVSTTLSSGIATEATSLVVASATGISAGMIIWLNAEEAVLVKAVNGTTITLVRPTFKAYSSGVSVKSFNVTYSVLAAAANSLFWHGYCTWYSAGAVYAHTPLCCTKQPLFRMTTQEDVLRFDPAFHHKIDAAFDLNSALDDAWNDVIRVIQTRGQAAHLFRASGHEFTKAVIMRFFANFYMSRISENENTLYDRYKELAKSELDLAVTTLPRDVDEDGITNSGDELFTTRTIDILR